MCRRLTLAILTVLLLGACSETKYVAEGEYLLDHVKVKMDTENSYVKPEELKSFVRQRGNTRWFSTVKIPLRTYSFAADKPVDGCYPAAVAEQGFFACQR